MLRTVLPLLLTIAACDCFSSTEKMDDDDAGTDAGPEGPDPVPADTLCREFADQFCRGNERCCGRASEVYGSLDDCTRVQREMCQNRAVGFEFPEEVMDETILFNQGRIGAALDRVTNAVDDCRPIDFPEEILDGFTGNVEEGGACVWVSCRAGLACVGGTCVPQPAEGTSCTADGECGALHCWSDGMCRAFAGPTASCDTDDDCETRLCADGICATSSADTTYCVRQDEERRPFLR
jgi:hypothetical protein